MCTFIYDVYHHTNTLITRPLTPPPSLTPNRSHLTPLTPHPNGEVIRKPYDDIHHKNEETMSFPTIVTLEQWGYP